jgi:hypothetical protein
MSVIGTSRHFAATQQFGRLPSEADTSRAMTVLRRCHRLYTSHSAHRLRILAAAGSEDTELGVMMEPAVAQFCGLHRFILFSVCGYLVARFRAR